MRRKLTVKRVATGMIVPVCCIALISYFSWHAVYGEYGAFKLTRLDERLVIRTAELDVVTSERTKLERRVHLMQPGRVDPDLLDEQSRATLGYSEPDELTVYLNDTTR